MRDLLGLGLIAGSSWTLGSIVVARLQWPELAAYERLALQMLAGLGLTALVLSILALVSSLSSAPLILAVVSLVGALAAFRARTNRSGGGKADPATGSMDAVTLAVVVAAALACLGAVAPVTDDDALAYVVPIARHIAHTGGATVWPDQARSMWPLSQQVLLAFLLQIGGERLGLLTAFEWLLCVGVLSALARRACERTDHIAPALVIGLGAPVTAFLIASAKEDLLVVAATAATGLCFVERKGIANAAAGGFFAGIAAAAKYPGAAVPLAAVLWTLVDRRERRVRDAVVVSLGAAFSGGLWYALNAWRYGNPVAPFFAGAAGTPLDAATVREFVNSYGAGRGLLSFFLAPIQIFLRPGLFCGRANLYNPVVYAGIAALWQSRLRHRHAPLLFMAGVLYVVWFLTLQNARLLLPAMVLVAPAAADCIVPLVRRSKWLLAPAAALALVSIGVVVAVGGLRFARYAGDRGGFLARETQNYADIQWMNAHLDRLRARVASDHKALDHLEIPWLFLDPTYQLAISRTELNRPDEFLSACRRNGITHLFGSADSFANIREHLRPIYRNDSSRLGGVRFFREPPTESTAVFQIMDAPH